MNKLSDTDLENVIGGVGQGQVGSAARREREELGLSGRLDGRVYSSPVGPDGVNGDTASLRRPGRDNLFKA